MSTTAMTAQKPRKYLTQPRTYHRMDVRVELRADESLPPGIAGRLTGIALTYDVVDTYDTMFARGCAKRSIDTKVAARKLPLLMDHERTVRAHVGVVATMTDMGDALLMTADLLDTPEGRACKEYAQAVMAAGAATGFSIGFVPRRSERVMVDGKPVERFLEIELREVSITPMPAVPGTDLTAARANEAPAEVETQDAPERSDAELLELAARMALDALAPERRAALLDTYTRAHASRDTIAHADAPTQVRDTTKDTASNVTMAERLAAVRASFHTACDAALADLTFSTQSN